MRRSLTYDVITLRVRPAGESNREAWFLSGQEGIFRATVFGGPKSRLRAFVAPFHEGRLWIYQDPVRNSRKVTDFDVTAWRPGLRERYEAAIAADVIAETVLETLGGGGNWEDALRLAGDVLDCLEVSPEKNIPRVTLHFFWRWTEFLGVSPDVTRCAGCACEAPDDGILWYNLREAGLFCEPCLRRGSSSPDIALGPGARRWLAAAGNLAPQDALRYSLDAASMRQARAFVLGILTETLGKRLPLWDY